MKYTYTVHYKLCDDVLNNIRQNDDMHEVNIEPFLAEDRRVKLAIVRKLDKDGYIRRVNPQEAPFIISITVEGRQFWIDGGYKAKFEELEEKERLEKELLKTNVSLNKLSRSNIILQGAIALFVAIFVGMSTCYQAKTYKMESDKNSSISKDTSVQNLIRRVKILEHKMPLKTTPKDSIKH